MNDNQVLMIYPRTMLFSDVYVKYTRENEMRKESGSDIVIDLRVASQ